MSAPVGSIRGPSNPARRAHSHRAGGAFLGMVVLVTLVLSASGLGGGSFHLPVPASSHASDSAGSAPATARGGPWGSAPVSGIPSTENLSTAQLFDQRVADVGRGLEAAGVAPRDIRLPYVGRPAEVVDGAVVPGYALGPEAVNSSYNTTPAPAGIAYYGENDTTGRIDPSTLDASSVAGTVTVGELTALYLDDDTPDMWGIQLNAVQTNVTVQGTRGYQFWTQNTIDYFQHNDVINFGEDTWNFSSLTAVIPAGNSTILRHDINGSNIEGIYIGTGPTLYAPPPFTLTLYVNSSVTPAGDDELWYNYSLWTSVDGWERGNYDWLVFNSEGSHHLGPAPLAPFEASGSRLDPEGLTNDFELDFGIGPYDGSTLNVLSANTSATLDYCPAVTASCTSGEFRSVPAAEDFGGETGETTTGLSLSYNGTTARGTGGPLILRGLWGFSSAPGAAAGVTPVTNAITVAGGPVAGSGEPYVFVFLNGSTFIDPRFEWAPDVRTWYLPPGTYQYEVMLADYAEQTGTLTVGVAPTELSATLAYAPSSGVYTPLWAFNNSELAGISSAGSGTVADQFRLFNNPTVDCTACGNARNGNLSAAFADWSSFGFPVFAGVLLYDTDSFVEIDHPVSFCVYGFTYGPVRAPLPGPYFYLQIELVWTHNVTLANDTKAGGWPDMYEIGTLAGPLNASENPFPQANVMVWNSTHDLLMSNAFVPAWLVPAPETPCTGVCPAVTCQPGACVSPDGLLLYGGTNNTVWGNTFEDPRAPANAPPTFYAGLAEAESGDLIFNNNFSVDNPTVLMAFDIYNNSCPDGYAGDCGPPLPPTYLDTWNVTVQPATRVAATVNGFGLSGNILGSGCKDQGGNYWSDYGNALNPIGALPFANSYDYAALGPALPSWWAPNETSIQIGGDYAPLVANVSTSLSCVSGVYIPAPIVLHPTLTPEYVALAVSVATGCALGVSELVLARRRGRLATPAGSISGDLIARGAELMPLPARPSLRERLARRPPGIGFVVGAGILVTYLGVALSALLVFPSSLSTLPENTAWVPLENPIGPSWAHPFGVMPGWGTDLFDAIWRATPWDLGIIAGILAIDVFLGFFLGAIAGLNEGGVVDGAITFVCDSLGSIPAFLLAIVVFAGLVTVAPGSVGLPLFVIVFGVILWPTMARTVRERARTVSHQQYVESARASGSSFPRTLVRHILPNSLGPVLAQLPLEIVPVFFVLSAFPWWYNCQLPGGPIIPPYTVPPPYLVPYLPPFSPLPSASFPEWGYLLGFGTCEGFGIPGGFDYWWMYLFPLLAIVGLGVAIGLVCDGIERWRRLDR